MDHNYAIENHVAEGYLLDDLNESERDAYEDHFFGCTTCAEEVETVSRFIDTAKQVIQGEFKVKVYSSAAQPSFWGNWLNWRSIMQPLPAAACVLVVALTGFSGYQNRVTIPQLKDQASAQIFALQPVIRNSKGPAVTALTGRRGRGFLLHFDIPPTEFSSFDVSLVTASNDRKLSLKNISRQDANQTLEMFVPAGTLEARRYFLLIEGNGPQDKGKVDKIPFDIKFQD